MTNLQKISDIVLNKRWVEFTELGIDMRHYEDLGMVLLDYNQIEAKDNHPVSDECRGLLMGYDGTILRKGFTRFYNYTQAGHDSLDVQNSVIHEKCDGSLMFVYWCEATNRWELGTRGTAFASGSANFHPTFRDFFLECLDVIEEKFQSDCTVHLNKEYTYLFEGVGPDNIIVAKYETNHAVFLGCVENATGKEFLIPGHDEHLLVPDWWNVRLPLLYKFNTTEECVESLAQLPERAEGYVLYNRVSGKRIKLKDPRYVLLHKIRGNGLTVNSICELVASNEHEEYIASFPADAEKFISAIEELHFMQRQLQVHYDMNKHIESQKDFALAVKDLPLSGCMFKARKNGTDVLHEFNQFPVSKRADWLKERLA